MRDCPICQSERRDCIFTTPTGQTIQCCSNCGMVYADDTPIVDYAKHSMYICAATYPPKDAHYERIVENCIAAGIKNTASVLDVGCALGNQMKKFLAAGFKTVHGLSISSEEVARCEEQGLTALHRNLANMGPLAPYDLVIVSHVLEHVPDVMGFLRSLRQWVKPGGSIYVEVPDALRYSDCFTSICQGFNNEHINHFDENHLHAALVWSGFPADGGSYIAEDGHPYPCVWMLAEVWDGGNRLRTNVERYRDTLIAQMDQVTKRLETQLGYYVGKSIAIWGAGQTARQLLDGTFLGKLKVECATDTNPAYHGLTIHECPIVAPHMFRPRPQIPIVVCSQLSQKVIVESIRNMGLQNRMITLGDE